MPIATGETKERMKGAANVLDRMQGRGLQDAPVVTAGTEAPLLASLAQQACNQGAPVAACRPAMEQWG